MQVLVISSYMIYLFERLLFCFVILNEIYVNAEWLLYKLAYLFVFLTKWYFKGRNRRSVSSQARL